MTKNTTRVIIMVSVVALLAIMVGSMTRSVQKQAGDTSGLGHRRTEDPLFATELNDTLAVLEDPNHRDAESIDLRIEAQSALSSYIEFAGGSLFDRAIDCVLQWPADTELRKRAMLILAQVPLREDQKSRLHESRIPEVRAYYHILGNGSKDALLTTIRSVQPDDVHEGSSPDVKPIPGENSG
jgi:hypothetical protein